jgi:hypothetical protein
VGPLIAKSVGTVTMPWKAEKKFKKYTGFGIGLKVLKELSLKAYENMRI